MLKPSRTSAHLASLLPVAPVAGVFFAFYTMHLQTRAVVRDILNQNTYIMLAGDIAGLNFK